MHLRDDHPFDFNGTNHMNDALIAATEWYLRIHAEDVSEKDWLAFNQWKEASPENGQAWARIQQVNQSFEGLEPAASKAALQQPKSLARRQTIKNMSIFIVAGSAGYLTYRQQPWQGLWADYTTEKGASRTLQLSDETTLVLNTDTAIDSIYSNASRTIHLIKGEVLIETGHGAGSAVPFNVHTKFGEVTALGTRFSVRIHESYISVNVYKDSVRISTPTQNQQKILTANQTATCNEHSISEVTPLALGSDLWAKGILVVTHMPLKTFLAEINRYYTGFLRCDPSIAQMDISGSFPLNDMQAIFDNLQSTYPIQIDSFTSYWVTLKPA